MGSDVYCLGIAQFLPYFFFFISQMTESGATKCTGLGALLATTSSEYRRLLKLPGLERLASSFERAMRAYRFGKLCPI